MELYSNTLNFSFPQTWKMLPKHYKIDTCVVVSLVNEQYCVFEHNPILFNKCYPNPYPHAWNVFLYGLVHGECFHFYTHANFRIHVRLLYVDEEGFWFRMVRLIDFIYLA